MTKHEMSNAELIGWLLFGAIAVGVIWLLTRNRSVSASSCGAGMHEAGAEAGDPVCILAPCCVPDSSVSVSQTVTSPGPFQGTQVPGVSSQPGNSALESNGCWDPQLYASKLYPQEEVVTINGAPKLLFHGAGPNGSDIYYPGCPNEVLRLRP